MNTGEFVATMRAYHVLFRVVVKKRVLMTKRYWVNFVGQIVAFMLVFVAVFFGGMELAGDRFGDHLGGIMVGFFLWYMALTAYTGLANWLMGEARMGTLEQLYLSSFGLGRLNVVNVVVNIGMAIFWGTVTLVLMLVITREPLHIDPVTVVPLILFTLLAPVGLGFAMAGLALLFKQISSLFQLMRFALLGFIALPADGSSLFPWLPLTLGSDMLRVAMEENQSLIEFSAPTLATLVLQGLLYLVMGYAILYVCLDKAKERGTLGHY